MNKLIENCLFLKDKDRFNILRTKASDFRNTFIGETIVRDSIFDVIQNYVKSKEHEIKLLKFPIDDTELWAFTCLKDGIIFVTINTALPFNNQIFAAAHELYHISCYLEEDNTELIRKGSILDSRTIDTGTTEEEEMEANAFAGALLAPVDDIEQQIRIFRINRFNIRMDDILTLMDIFAIPYKAMVLRLLEEEIISKERATELINIPSDEVAKRQVITGKARRWALVPKGHEKLGSIMENITINEEEESIPQSRLQSDLAKLQKIKERYGIE